MSALGHDLIGHEDAVRQVTEAFASGRMHHAWLLTGIEGIGKSSLAWHIADHVLSNGRNPIGKHNPQDRVTKLIQAEAHPDLLSIRRAVDEKTGDLRNVIVVDDALKVASFLRKTSTHGGWRVVIVDEAHRLNRFGENAILKILEEPPPRALILITATTPGALLPTIRSRCRMLTLAPLGDAQMKVILMRSAPDLSQDQVERLVALSGGSAGFALKVARTETLPLYEEMNALLDSSSAPDMPRLHKLADQISRKADAESFEVMRALLLDRLRRSALQTAREDAGQSATEYCLDSLDKTAAIFAAAEQGNLDRKLAFTRAVAECRNP